MIARNDRCVEDGNNVEILGPGTPMIPTGIGG